MAEGKFTVDTHLFRELGELLVGRDSTALVELIKNAYDADATTIIVNGISLDNPAKSRIIIDDNGTGMNAEQFQNGFLRIASRLKEEGNRLSKRYKRRFTGSKGIGRLAAHKLASILEIESSSKNGDNSNIRAISALIDWDRIEAKETLDQISPIDISTESISSSSKMGTVITLRRLRRKWTKTERARFINEARTFEPPHVLTHPLPKDLVGEPLLFDKPLIRESSSQDPGCHVELVGDFASGDEYWKAIIDAANWVIEIDAQKGKVQYVVAPTHQLVRKYPSARVQRFSFDHPNSDQGPFFQARILLREGQMRGPRGQTAWANQVSGIRVFMEGFRILPYGEPGDDWLSLEKDTTSRSRTLSLLDQESIEGIFDDEQDSDWALGILPNRHYFGAAFLTQPKSPSLRILVNREGFVPDSSFDALRRIVRLGIDLSTRLRARVSFQRRLERKSQRAVPRTHHKESLTEDSESSRSDTLEKVVKRASSSVRRARQRLAEGDSKGAAEELSQARPDMEHIETKLISESAMLRVLASVGTQMASFVHEISGLLGVAESLYEAVGRLREDISLPGESRRSLARLHAALGDLKRSLERQASYLLDVVTPDARRRRSRQSLVDRLDAGVRLIERMAERRGITIQNEIPPDLKSPPMFPAELTTIFSNLLTNAVKAAGANGKIRAKAKSLDNGTIAVVIENTGEGVSLTEADRWFQPFESTTAEVDPVLGQGMGLGLPITRSMLEEYGAEIRFKPPSRGYATAVEILFTQ